MKNAEELYALDPAAPFDGQLGTRITAAIKQRRTVVWMSGSGALLLIAGDSAYGFVAQRSNAFDPMPIDQHALHFTQLDASSCGMWAVGPHWYRSSPPVLVTAHEADRATEELPAVRDRWEHLLRRAHDDDPQWRTRVREGHPRTRCPAPECTGGQRGTPPMTDPL